MSLTLGAQPRPLTHQDYDSWRSILNQRLSNDGKYLAYALFPQEGDGECVIRNLSTGKEWREPAGARPPAPRPNFALNPDDPPPQPPGLRIAFTRDSRTVVFSTFPPKAETDQAKRDKKKPEDMPKNGLVILDLASGKAVPIARVKSFQVPDKGDGVVAYLHESEQAKAKGKEYGGDLALRTLATGAKRVFPDVMEYALSKDAGTLVYAVSSKKEETNGVYAAGTSGDAPPAALLTGRGKYAKLVWDEAQTQVAFVSNHDDAGAKQSPSKLYRWDRSASTAEELVSPATPGLRKGFAPSDKGAVTFSKDGRHIFFGCAPASARPEKDEAANTPVEDRVSVDLWHWKDDYIQPMQKVRAEADKNRSYRAVWHVSDKKLVQLADQSMPEAVSSEDGLWAIGGDDREYRSMREYDESYTDSYLIDTVSGSRKLAAKKHLGRVTWSPNGRYALFFNGTDWNTISVPDGRVTNVTANLGVKFWREDHDSPGSSPSYGSAGWTRDGKYVLLYDHYDVWRVNPDGSLAKNITAGLGRKQHLTLRYVKLDPDPNEKGIDPAEPLLFSAENDDTHDSGFYQGSIGGDSEPRKLLFGAKHFTPPVKAKDADVLLLTAQTFREFPDLQTTDSSFRELRKVSDANPQISKLLWGSAELVHFRNADGVPLSAALYKPDNFDPKKKYPLLVYIYERLAQNVHHFVPPAPSHNINISFYVSNGYLVLQPDIVYKTGYPGQSALKCVMPAVQEMVDRGYVDENAIGIQGHSWGGYQIAYMITQTNRFRAVAAGAPVANMTSAYDGIRWGPGIPRQFQYERTQSRIGGSLWQYPLRYIENSPVFMADRVTTPVMMIHNDADDAVPWYQGIEYYLALRRLGKEVYLFTYNGEPHGLRRRPNQKDYTVRLQQYFDHYLKGAPRPDWMDKGIPYLEKVSVSVDAQ